MSLNTSPLPGGPVYDASTPFAGVRVSPCPGDRKHLPLTQARNSRVPSEEGVMRMVPICKAVGLGMMSTVNTARCLCQVHEFRKGCAPGTIRPGSRRRGHAHRPGNMAFSGKRITARVEQDRGAAEVLKNLSRFHLAILSGKTGVRAERVYESSRRKAVVDFPQIITKLAAIEAAHEFSVR